MTDIPAHASADERSDVDHASLAHPGARLDPAQIAAQLSTARFGRSLVLKQATASTNDDARQAANLGAADGHVVIADAQTSGRGSRGRSWLSPPGTDLYLSLVARLALPPTRLPPLTLAVGLAVAEAVDALLGAKESRALVKWPNDVWVGRKKLAGVLVEGASAGDQLEPLVIGVGINVNRRAFPSELAQEASSLALELDRTVDRSLVLATFLNRLEPWVDRFVAEGTAPVVRALNERLALQGERATCGEEIGIVERVTDSGALLLATEHGPRECTSGTLRACETRSEAPA